MNFVTRKNGKRSKLPGKTNLDLVPGDRIRVETPGGGAWGRARSAKGSPTPSHKSGKLF
jgi:N-methylhydantoinase B/oxoprolinase/acetone carboxylase alpha subunit